MILLKYKQELNSYFILENKDNHCQRQLKEEDDGQDNWKLNMIQEIK